MAASSRTTTPIHRRGSSSVAENNSQRMAAVVVEQSVEHEVTTRSFGGGGVLLGDDGLLLPSRPHHHFSSRTTTTEKQRRIASKNTKTIVPKSERKGELRIPYVNDDSKGYHEDTLSSASADNDDDDDDDDDDDEHVEKVPTTSSTQPALLSSLLSSFGMMVLFRRRRRWLNKLLAQFPVLGDVAGRLNRVPRRYKFACFAVWIVWKFVATFAVFYFVGTSLRQQQQHQHQQQHHTDGGVEAVVGGRALAGGGARGGSTTTPPPVKVLFIVTSLAEYNNGRRSTIKGSDRLGDLVLPVLVDSVESIIMAPYEGMYTVDVFLILAYQLKPERREEIRDRLPAAVGLQVWDDACPLGYARDLSTTVIRDNTRALSRQHRLVVKDKFPYYDLFLAFEDDMRVTGAHVQHFLQMSEQLDRLRRREKRLRQHEQQEESTVAVVAAAENMDPGHQKFFGGMSQRQLDRLIPGFVRVEVLLDPDAHGAQKQLDPVPVDHKFKVKKDAAMAPAVAAAMGLGAGSQHGIVMERHFQPQYCCHVQMHPNKETPMHPPASHVVIWETGIKALSVRELPSIVGGDDNDNDNENETDNNNNNNNHDELLGWVGLLPGPGKRLPAEEKMGGYWSGRRGAFGVDLVAAKPSPGMPDLIAQQGGWMATREQIWRLDDEKLCMGSFLPPYDKPKYGGDGQESNNVEFWSGGYQFFTGVFGGCNMQRVLTLHPDHFSKHFLYHVANNKQRQLSQKRMLLADHFMGQLNTVQKWAQKEKERIIEQKQKQRR